MKNGDQAATNTERPPRWYAQQIYQRPKERETELLARVPKHLQEMVASHVRLWRERPKRD